MADSSIKGILSLKDVVIRQNNNVWPPANIFFNTTYVGNRVYAFNIYTQQRYANQFLYYVITTVDAANPIAASDFTDNTLSGQLFLGQDGSTTFTKTVHLNNKKIFNIQLRTGSISGTILDTSNNIEIGLGDFSVIPVELLVVGGGGGGGSFSAGGGGGGGVINTTANLRTYASYTLTVGSKGIGGGFPGSGGIYGNDGTGGRGGDTRITPHVSNTIIAYGGGGGGIWNFYSYANYNGASGGGSGTAGSGQGQSGPGIGVYPGSTYISTTRQGYDGALGVSADSPNGAGGGGGAGGAAGAGTGGTGGAGGPGLQYSTSGTAIYYGAGGGGGSRFGTGGAGGTDTGGAGTGPGIGANATPYTGSGGGGGGTNGTGGGNGAEGVIIIKYPATYLPAAIATGSPNVTISGGYRTYRFWQSGTFALVDPSTL
jgi:hypothetical protein